MDLTGWHEKKKSFPFRVLSGKVGKQSLRFRPAITFFFGITVNNFPQFSCSILNQKSKKEKRIFHFSFLFSKALGVGGTVKWHQCLDHDLVASARCVCVFNFMTIMRLLADKLCILFLLVR